MANVVSDVLQVRLELLGLGGFVGGMERAAEAMGLLDRAATPAQRRMLGLGVGAAAAAAGIATGLGRAAVEAGKLQQVQIGFESTLGSAEAAQRHIQELQEFAQRTPFNFEASARGSQQLLAMGASAQQVIPIMTALGNAVSAAGKGQEEYQGALAAVGQIITKGKVSQEELLQLAERGIPVFKILQRELGLSAAQMADIGRQGITAEQAVNALVNGLNRDFGGAMDRQSRTLIGSWSSLQDAGQQLAISLGQPLVEPATTVVRLLTDIINAANKAPAPIKGMAAAIGVGAVGALILYSAKVAKATLDTGKLAAETLRLANAHYQAANAATAHAQAEGAVSGAAGKGAGRAKAGQAAGTASQAAAAAAGATGLRGLAGKAGGFLKGKGGGIAGIAASLAADAALGALPDDGGLLGGLKRFGGAAVSGAGTGALAGSIIPGLGTVGGAIIGGIAGVGGELAFGGKKGDAAKAQAEDPALAELRKINATLQAQLDEQKRSSSGPGVDPGVIAAAEQVRLLRFARALG